MMLLLNMSLQSIFAKIPQILIPFHFIYKSFLKIILIELSMYKIVSQPKNFMHLTWA